MKSVDDYEREIIAANGGVKEPGQRRAAWLAWHRDRKARDIQWAEFEASFDRVCGVEVGP